MQDLFTDLGHGLDTGRVNKQAHNEVQHAHAMALSAYKTQKGPVLGDTQYRGPTISENHNIGDLQSRNWLTPWVFVPNRVAIHRRRVLNTGDVLSSKWILMVLLEEHAYLKP